MQKRLEEPLLKIKEGVDLINVNESPVVKKLHQAMANHYVRLKESLGVSDDIPDDTDSDQRIKRYDARVLDLKFEFLMLKISYRLCMAKNRRNKYYRKKCNVILSKRFTSRKNSKSTMSKTAKDETNPYMQTLPSNSQSFKMKLSSKLSQRPNYK